MGGGGLGMLLTDAECGPVIIFNSGYPRVPSDILLHMFGSVGRSSGFAYALYSIYQLNLIITLMKIANAFMLRTNYNV